MVFGHNTNLSLGHITFHVQTEDRGIAHALIDTTVYFHGRVLHRRTNNYFDLLPLNEDREQALKLRLEEQHRTVIDEIRSGELHLAVPPGVPPAAAAISAPPLPAPAKAASTPRKLRLELTNAKSWLNGRLARLQVSVHEEEGAPVPGALVKVEIEGATNGSIHLGETGPDGSAMVQFEMPFVTSPEAALIIQAEDRGVHGLLRFALRAKPRVPSL